MNSRSYSHFVGACRTFDETPPRFASLKAYRSRLTAFQKHGSEETGRQDRQGRQEALATPSCAAVETGHIPSGNHLISQLGPSLGVAERFCTCLAIAMQANHNHQMPRLHFHPHANNGVGSWRSSNT